MVRSRRRRLLGRIAFAAFAIAVLAAVLITFFGAPSNLAKRLPALGKASPVVIPGTYGASIEGRRVLVLINMDDPDSVKIGTYYQKKRGVPRENLVLLHTTTSEDISDADYESQIETPTLAQLHASKNPIDFMLFTRGIPIRLSSGPMAGYSVDCRLATEDIASQTKDFSQQGVKGLVLIENPYYQKNEPFSRAKFGYCLPSRLDGYTDADRKALVDHSLAAKSEKGPFVFDEAGNRKDGGYGELQKDLALGASEMEKKGYEVIHDTSDTFIAPDQPMEGYASWGSNDGHFDMNAYHKLKFKPGAVAETFVSTSGRTFNPTTGGQSLIADLIHQGVTGVKGYVSEPYTLALAQPSILFDRYTSGYNLAESFWMASPTMRWKEVLIGDPLCSPYAK